MKSNPFWQACGLAVVLAKLLVWPVCAATENPEKTLVSWVTVGNAAQRGGSALTIQRGDQFDAIVFGEQEAGQWMARSDFFAPESLLTPDGRRVMWAWCLGGGNDLWDGIQSLPRELSLPDDGVLRIKPLRELERLRYYPMIEPAVMVREGQTHRLNSIAGDAVEIQLRIRQSGARRYGVRLHASPDDTRGIDLVVDPGARTIQLGATTAPFDLPRRADIQLRIFIDRRIVEVFANDRQAIFKQHAYGPEETGVCLFSEGGNMDVKEIKAWKMAAANPW